MLVLLFPLFLHGQHYALLFGFFAQNSIHKLLKLDAFQLIIRKKDIIVSLGHHILLLMHQNLTLNLFVAFVSSLIRILLVEIFPLVA